MFEVLRLTSRLKHLRSDCFMKLLMWVLNAELQGYREKASFHCAELRPTSWRLLSQNCANIKNIHYNLETPVPPKTTTMNYLGEYWTTVNHYPIIANLKCLNSQNSQIAKEQKYYLWGPYGRYTKYNTNIKVIYKVQWKPKLIHKVQCKH